MRRLLLALSFELSALSFAFASEFHETLVFADGAFLQGRLEDAEKSYRYAVALDPNSLEAQLDLALTLRDLGRDADALPAWVKSTFLAPGDPAVWEGRAWNALQLGRADEAHDAFRKAVALSTGAAAWTVYFGDGLAYARDRERGEAVQRFKGALLADPLKAAPMALLARTEQELREPDPAIQWYRRALAADPLMREASEGLARMLKSRGEPDPAWQLAGALLETDPADPGLRRFRDSLRSSLRKRPEDLLPQRRLSWPLLEKAQPAPEGPALKVALFADAAGLPAALSSFTFLSNVAFRVVDSRLGEVAAGRRLESWRVSFDPGTGLISLKAVRGDDSYATRSALELAPAEPGGDLLLKDVAGPAAAGRDLGDRELRGRLILEPVPGAGIRLSLDSALEDYLRGALAAAVPEPAQLESLKALAVVLRSRARSRAAGAGLHPGAAWSHCDSAHCGLFLGVQEEHPQAAQAVAETRGAELSWRGVPAQAQEHGACGGRTQSAEGLGRDLPYLSEVSDGAPAAGSPWKLERFTQALPADRLWCLAAHPEAETAVRWTRVLDADGIAERLSRLGLKGGLRELLPGARSSTGRLLTLRAVGSKGTLELNGDAEISQALSPGTLRSTWFTMRVLRDRRGRPDSVLLWGAGTGHGLGLCRLGADGLAASGSDFQSILAHYFPKAELKKPATRSLAPKPKPSKSKEAKKKVR